MADYGELGRRSRAVIAEARIEISIDRRHQALKRLVEDVDELVTGSEGACRSGHYLASIPRLERAMQASDRLREELLRTYSRVKTADVMSAFR